MASEVQTKTVVIYKKSSSSGVMSGVVGSIFAILGIFTFGIIFLPFAALFSLISILRCITGLSASGTAVALMSCILTGIGFSLSPTTWPVVAGLLGLAANLNHSPSAAPTPELSLPLAAPQQPVPAPDLTPQMADADTSALAASFRKLRATNWTVAEYPSQGQLAAESLKILLSDDSSGMVQNATKIWFFRKIPMADGTIDAIFFQTKINEGHANGAHISVITWKSSSEGKELVKSQPGIDEVGEFGEAFIENENVGADSAPQVNVSMHRFNKDSIILIVDGGEYCTQGDCTYLSTIYLYNSKNGWVRGGSIITGEDNIGELGDNYSSWSGKIIVKTDRSAEPTIYLTSIKRRGTGNHLTNPISTRYRFNGSEYLPH